MKKRLAIALRVTAVATFLAGGGCAVNPTAPPNDSEGVKQELERSKGHGHITLPTRKSTEAKPQLVLPKFNPAAIIQSPSLLDRQFSVAVRRVPVRTILYSLAKDAGIQLDLHPIPNRRVTLVLRQVPLRVILDKLSRQAGIAYEYKNGVLTIFKDEPVWKSYQIDYVNIAKKVQGSVSLNMSVGNAVVGEGGSTSQGNNQTSITVSSEQDFWTEIEKGILALVGNKNDAAQPGTTPAAGVQPVVMNREAGLISVYAPRSKQQVVKLYLDEVLKRAKQQVLIEATVVEVELSDKFQSGIDWAALQVTNGDRGQLTTTYPFHIVSDPLKNNFAQKFNFDFGIKFLQQFGKAKVLSTPKIMAINNQTAILKVVDNQVYFTTEVNSSSNDTTTTTTFETQVHTVPVGFMMTLTPFVNDGNEITLYVRPTLSRILGYVKDPHPDLARAGVESLVPIIQEREVSSTLKLKDKQIAIIGGLMQDESKGNDDSLPGFGAIPGAGHLFTSYDKDKKKTELVIFIRPVIVRNPSITNGELNRYSEQFKKLLPAQ